MFNQNENINKLKAELANCKGSHQTMLSQNKTMKENLLAKEKELDFWIEEYNKQLEEKSIEPSLIDRNTIREMLHSAEDWNAIRRHQEGIRGTAGRVEELQPRDARQASRARPLPRVPAGSDSYPCPGERGYLLK